jgi:hypothetical protein
VIDRVRDWLHQHHAIGWLAAGAIGTFTISLAAGMAVMVLLPADYFVREPGPRGLWHSHAALRLALLATKNLLGSLLFVLGVIMAIPLGPGPGLLFMLVGIGLVDFPGKRSLERRLLRVPRGLASVNRLRARFHRPPIVIA